jgi:PhnB protein
MTLVNPYLSFSDNCEEAFNFYKSSFGGEFTSLSRFKEMPAEHWTKGEEEKIMHVALPIGEGTVLMGSDRPGAMGKVAISDSFSIAIAAGSEAETTKLFNGLSAGGKVTMPLAKVPWATLFGMFTDKFGVSWMINCASPTK